MKKPSKNIAATVADIIGPTVSQLDYDLWDVEYVKEGSEYYLRITIDREEGINIDDCEKVHRAIDPLLDEADPIQDSYHLEVSSPGIERELKYDWHFDEFIGAEIEVRLYAPMNGSKVLKGVLVSHSEAETVINDGKNDIALSNEKISKVQTVFDFDDIKD